MYQTLSFFFFKKNTFLNIGKQFFIPSKRTLNRTRCYMHHVVLLYSQGRVQYFLK